MKKYALCFICTVIFGILLFFIIASIVSGPGDENQQNQTLIVNATKKKSNLISNTNFANNSSNILPPISRPSQVQSISHPPINFIRSLFGVGYSPYVKNYDVLPSTNVSLKLQSKGITPSWNNYTSQDVLIQMHLLSQHFGLIISFGMGTTDSSQTFQQVQAMGLAALAAAKINSESKSTLLQIIQGVHSSSDERITGQEIENALFAADEANLLHPGTVLGISFFNLFNLDEASLWLLLETYKRYKSHANYLKLQIGTRVHKCDSILETQTNAARYIQEIGNASDFVLCSIFPSPREVQLGPEFAVQEIGKRFLAARKLLLEINPKLVIYNGETGWPSQGVSYNEGNSSTNTMTNSYRFWAAMNSWAEENNLPIVLFEAFDEPWKSDPGKLDPNDPSGRWGSEGHYGWWTFKDNNKPDSYIEKYLDPDQYKPLKIPPTPTKLIGRVHLEPINSEKIQKLDNSYLSFALIFLAFLVIIQAGVNIGSKLREKKTIGDILSKEEIDQFIKGHDCCGLKIHNKKDDQEEVAVTLPYNQDYEIPKEKLFIDTEQLLGIGNFGIVYKGKILIDKYEAKVALKTVKDQSHLAALRGMLAEIKIMSYIGVHENVVKFIGAYTAEINKGIIFVAVEFCEFGNLEKYLRHNKEDFMWNLEHKISYQNFYRNSTNKTPADDDSNKDLAFFTLCTWSLEIAKGMEYLASKKVIHADLATRNILLDSEKRAKITDFGLSCRMYEYTEYVKSTQELLPWRWMALEALKWMQFSIQSDVWSFGITLWELFSLGQVPYPGLNWDLYFVSKLEGGMRMSQPKYATEQIFEKMSECWQSEPKDRPTFSHLVEFFESIVLYSAENNPQNYL